MGNGTPFSCTEKTWACLVGAVFLLGCATVLCGFARPADTVAAAGMQEAPLPETIPACCLVNRPHNLRMRFGADAVTISSAETGGRRWSLVMALSAYGYERALQAVPPVMPAAAGSEVAYRRSAITEWYKSDPRGIEQGFTLHAPPLGPAGAGLVALQLQVTGGGNARMVDGGEGVRFKNRTGKTVLDYRGLKVWDAAGTVLPARMTLGRTGEATLVSILFDDRAAVYPVTVDPLLTAQQQKLTASDAADNDYLGYAAAISGITSTYAVVLGAYGDDDGGAASGAAYSYERNRGGTDNWGQAAKITAPDAAAGDNFGWSVAVDQITDTYMVLVGAPGDGGNIGAAYLYDCDLSIPACNLMNKITDTAGAGNDYFGRAVAIAALTDSYLLAIGADGDDSGVAAGNEGTAFVYQFSTALSTTTLLKKVFANDGIANDYFGRSVALSAVTESAVLVVGSYEDDDGGGASGSAYVFERDEGGSNNWGQADKLTASDDAAGDWFGYAVAVNRVTSTYQVAVGAPGNDGSTSAAYLFDCEFTTPSCSQFRKISPADATGNDYFGRAVALKGLTDTYALLVGADGNNGGGGVDSGSAYVFARDEGGSNNWGQAAKLNASDDDAGDLFGFAAALELVTDTYLAAVGAYSDDGAGGDRGAGYVFRIASDADLAVDKTDNPASVRAGNTLIYTISVTNLGPTNATNVAATDVLPSGTTYISATPSQGSYTTPTWTIGSLAAGATASMPISVVVDSAYTGGSLSNSVTVTADQNDSNAGNNSDVENTTVTQGTNLVLTKTDAADPVIAGTSLTYNLSLLNSGPSDALNVRVQDTLPAGVTYNAATPSAGTFYGPTTTWFMGSLAVGATASLSLTASVGPTLTGSITNTATAASDTLEDFPVNNTDTEGTLVNTLADIQLSLTDSPDPVTSLGMLTYNLSVTNNGPSDALGVAVAEQLPTGLTYAADTASQGTYYVTGTWWLGSLAAGTTASLSLTSTLDSAVTGPLVNSVTATSTTTDPGSANNSSFASTTVSLSSDLQLTQSDGVEPATAGLPWTYLLTIVNNGPSDATNVEVTDTLPSGVSLNFANPTAGVYNTVTDTWFVGTLARGASSVLTLVIDTHPGTIGYITNTADITGGDANDPAPANNTAAEGTLVARETNLAVTKTDSPDPVTAGNQLNYNLTVTNNGPSDAAGVRVSDPLPFGLSFVTALAAPATSTYNSITGDWDIAMLADGATASISITALVTSGVTVAAINNTAQLTAGQTQVADADDTATVATAVIKSADRAITAADSTDPVTAGNALTYILTATNNGPSDATGVTVSDALPAVLTYSASSGNGSYSSAADTWTVGTIASGTNAVMYITSTVNASATGAITNTAAITGTETDPAAANNSASEGTTINTSTDLSLTQTDSPDPVTAGSQLTYHLTVANNGPSNASGISAAETLPAAATYVSSNATQGVFYSVTETWLVGSLAVGATATLDIVVSIDAGTTGTISNACTVSGSQSDPTAANDTSSIDTTVDKGADLSVTKIDFNDPIDTDDMLTYLIIVTNAGPSDATGVELTERMPTALQNPEYSTDGGSTWATFVSPLSLGTITHTSSRQVRLRAQMSPITATAAITNTVTVTSAISDPNAANDTDNESTAILYDLEVRASGTGAGSVSNTQYSVNCASTCIDSYLYNTFITLTATASTGSTLESWSGCSLVEGTLCSITLTENTTATATFTLNSPTGTGGSTGGGSGGGTGGGSGSTSTSTVPSTVSTTTTTIDSSSGSTSSTTTVLTGLESLQAVFKARPRSGSVPLAVQFTDRSQGTVTGWEWNFGDGKTSVVENPEHTYTNPGSYNVVLSITSIDGLTDIQAQNNLIRVYPRLCIFRNIIEQQDDLEAVQRLKELVLNNTVWDATLTFLYYARSAQIVALLQEYPDLHARMVALMQEAIPVMTALQHAGTTVIPRELYQALLEFLLDLYDAADTELAEDLEIIIDNVVNGYLLEAFGVFVAGSP